MKSDVDYQCGAGEIPGHDQGGRVREGKRVGQAALAEQKVEPAEQERLNRELPMKLQKEEEEADAASGKRRSNNVDQ